jgi:hypothetical protein
MNVIPVPAKNGDKLVASVKKAKESMPDAITYIGIAKIAE